MLFTEKSIRDREKIKIDATFVQRVKLNRFYSFYLHTLNTSRKNFEKIKFISHFGKDISNLLYQKEKEGEEKQLLNLGYIY